MCRLYKKCYSRRYSKGAFVDKMEQKQLQKQTRFRIYWYSRWSMVTVASWSWLASTSAQSIKEIENKLKIVTEKVLWENTPHKLSFLCETYTCVEAPGGSTGSLRWELFGGTPPGWNHRAAGRECECHPPPFPQCRTLSWPKLPSGSPDLLSTAPGLTNRNTLLIKWYRYNGG